ncbi:oxidoreductase/oxygenase, vanB family [Janthinobacterium sp. Marseille]|nr:PDR/VanB family oxidoreductase [Janthinobacterium sp. Marseille]ABR89977.1 oxidoreductase/oxygenase, vanB family [Janthinobacterium sp. Marseille]
MNEQETRQVWVRAIRIEAEQIRSFELCPLAGERLPAAAAGAHIDVHLPNGLVRQYSLLHPGESKAYMIGVNRDPVSRGGSSYLHEAVKPGDVLTISVPRNNFPLHEEAAHSVLIAGGIGITPIFSMVQRLNQIGRAWTLYYCTRTEERAAFLDELKTLAATTETGNLHTVFDQVPGNQMLNLAELVQHSEAEHAGAAHFYCCGPGMLLQGFQQATATVAAERVHVEYFSAPAVASNVAAKTFSVTLARSGQTFQIPADQSILEVLLSKGVSVLSSCREGVCGSCETAVLAGEPEHRDAVLSAAERADNRTMMLCVSRCKGTSLTLDL